MIVDTPPILPVTDGALVATTVDAVIVAVRYGKRNYDDVTRTLASLRAVHAPIIGTVLTAVPQKSDEGRYVGSYSRYESGSDHKAAAPASSTTSVGDKDTSEKVKSGQNESVQEKVDQDDADLNKAEDDTAGDATSADVDEDTTEVEANGSDTVEDTTSAEVTDNTVTDDTEATEEDDGKDD